MNKSDKRISVFPFNSHPNQTGFEIRKLSQFLAVENQQSLEKPHRINFYSILFISKGSGQHFINFQPLDYQPGSILFIGKNQVHAFKFNQEADGYLLLFDEEFLNRNQIKFNDLAYSYPFNFDLYDTVIHIGSMKETFLSLLEYIYQEYQSINKHTDEILQCLLRTVLLKIRAIGHELNLIDSRVPSYSIKVFTQFQILFEKHFTDTRNANFYCTQLKISYKRLNDISKILTGKTLKKYIDDNLIIKAKQHLSFPDHNISEVSNILGFDETTNFTKYFRKHTGLSPSEFSA
ncbi:MAG: helix-turn-helix domain-containing protein [Bacteroidota bacterium]